MDEATIPILLVEDNPADVAIIQRSLKKGNLHNPVRVARDGAEAIDCLHDHVMQPGVLILDINLPKLDGMEVLRAAKRLDPETVAVMLTPCLAADGRAIAPTGGRLRLHRKIKRRPPPIGRSRAPGLEEAGAATPDPLGGAVAGRR